MAFSELRLMGELVVETLDKGVFGFLHMCASNGEMFVTPCGVIRKAYVLMFLSSFLLTLWLYGHLPERILFFMLFVLKKN